MYRGRIQHDSAHSLIDTVAKISSNFALTNDAPYLALTGRLWGVFRELIKGKRPRYIGSALYFTYIDSAVTVKFDMGC